MVTGVNMSWLLTGASGFVKDADSKAVHFEVFVAKSDKQALEDCINNKARVTGGQGYLLVKKEVTTYRLTSDSQHGFHDVAVYGPLPLPLAVKESDIVTHGANNFVKVRERTAALTGSWLVSSSCRAEMSKSSVSMTGTSWGLNWSMAAVTQMDF